MSNTTTFSWTEWIQNRSNSAQNASDSASDADCTELVQLTLFYQVAIAPALIITILFCFTERRKHLFPNFLHGRPGLVYPMDLTTKSKPMAYACAFGATTFFIFRAIVQEGGGMLFYSDDRYVHGLMVILVAVAYGMVYLPIFACLTMENAVGYGVGALYSWTLTIVGFILLWNNCQPDVTTWFQRFVIFFPFLMCCLYLSCNNTIQFYKTLKRGAYFNNKPDGISEGSGLTSIQLSVPGKHVQCLLTKTRNIQLNTSPSRRVLKFILDHTYSPDPRFQYSTRFLATMLSGAIILYQMVCLMAYKIHAVQGGRLFVDFGISALVISTLLSVYNMLRHASCYRRDMYRVYRGELKHQMKDVSNTNLLVGAMSYSSFEIIHLLFSFIINVILIALALWGVKFLTDYPSLIKALVQYFGPLLFWAFISFVSQRLAARFLFLRCPEESLALINRRLFFIFAHIIFFVNIIAGMVVFVLRTLINLFIVFFLLNRLDQSTYPAEYIRLDRGYRAYLGSLKLESSQNHPVMLVFLQLLMLSARKRREQGDGGNSLEKRRRAASFHWHLLYTLINNPSIRMERRGYLHNLRQIQNLGIILPKSDLMVDHGQYAICSLFAELEKEGQLFRSDSSEANQSRIKADIFRRLLIRIQNRIRRSPSEIHEINDEFINHPFDDEASFDGQAHGRDIIGNLHLQIRTDGINDNTSSSDGLVAIKPRLSMC